ncbi:MAG: hypothetical protein QG670_2670, partial [Thermoproteota archaeon]|nr:hypothetical protein [Thermoproteota archaeon]
MINIPKVFYLLNLANKRLHWHKDEMEQYQIKRLRAIIKHAYENVPYYHSLFKEAKIDLDSIKEISDLQKLPINQKSIFKKQPPELTVSSGMDIH